MSCFRVFFSPASLRRTAIWVISGVADFKSVLSGKRLLPVVVSSCMTGDFQINLRIAYPGVEMPHVRIFANLTSLLSSTLTRSTEAPTSDHAQALAPLIMTSLPSTSAASICDGFSESAHDECDNQAPSPCPHYANYPGLNTTHTRHADRPLTTQEEHDIQATAKNQRRVEFTQQEKHTSQDGKKSTA